MNEDKLTLAPTRRGKLFFFYIVLLLLYFCRLLSLSRIREGIVHDTRANTQHRQIYWNDFPQHMVFNLASVNEKRWITLAAVRTVPSQQKQKARRCSRAKQKTTPTPTPTKKKRKNNVKVDVRHWQSLCSSFPHNCFVATQFSCVFTLRCFIFYYFNLVALRVYTVPTCTTPPSPFRHCHPPSPRRESVWGRTCELLTLCVCVPAVRSVCDCESTTRPQLVAIDGFPHE